MRWRLCNLPIRSPGTKRWLLTSLENLRLCATVNRRTRHSEIHHFSMLLGGVREPREGCLVLDNFLLAEKIHRQITPSARPPRALRKTASLTSICHVTSRDPFRKQRDVWAPAGHIALDDLDLKLVVEPSDFPQQTAALHSHPNFPSIVELQQNRVS